MTKHIIISLLLSLLLPAVTAFAQILPRAGTHFTFGIPEGPDSVPDPSLSSSVLTVNILSKYDGKGIITSPNGYCQEFAFSSNTVTIITLPFSFMHLKDIGKTNKGILIKTSQPVNVVFHDFLPDAGEATQIYPDEALGTDYRITTWGIANDPPNNTANEGNHSQFIITATEDNTNVTITPSVKALGNHPAKIPIQTTLNRGECYIVKADINSVPTDVSLTNSTVISSRPVSILSAVSCGYVPLEAQACNEILDEILPRKITDTIFYVAPLRADASVQNTVLFTSDVQDFSVLTTNGSFFQSTNGRVVLQISKPEMYLVTAPAQCYELSNGADVQFGIGDPSMVTVLPRNQYVDTAFWYTPDFSSNGSRFDHYISVIYPTASESNVLLDGIPIASVSSPQMITSSSFSGTVAVIRPGVHSISSPVPVYGIAAGFTTADSYSFIAGTTAPKLPVDTTPSFLSITATDAKTCRTFDASVVASFHKENDINSTLITLTYDPALLTLLSVNLGPAAQGGKWTTDASIPGKITISASCMSAFTDSEVIANLSFSAGPTVTTTTITGKIDEMGGDRIYSAFAGGANKKIYIQEIRDTIIASFLCPGGGGHYGDTWEIPVYLLDSIKAPVSEVDFFLSYDHDIITLVSADLSQSTIAIIKAFAKASPPIRIDSKTDEIKITLQPPTSIRYGTFLELIFNSYVAPSEHGGHDGGEDLMTFKAQIINSRPCPLDIVNDTMIKPISGEDTCGTFSIRQIMRNQPFKINSIRPNPSNGSFTIDIDRHLFGGDPMYISLIDMLGNEVWRAESISGSINQQIPCTLTSVSNGTYFIRVAADGHIETQKIIIRN